MAQFLRGYGGAVWGASGAGVGMLLRVQAAGTLFDAGGRRPLLRDAMTIDACHQARNGEKVWPAVGSSDRDP